jgi:hypothetical protein
MRPVVRQTFVPFTAPLEGVIDHLYVDVKGLVSIGIGNLVDPIQLAMNLPMVHVDGAPAGRDEIATEWLRVKNQPADDLGRTAAQLGYRYSRRVTTLHLTPEGIDRLVGGKLAQNERILATAFPEWEEWPADAQLATLSMAWAVGPMFHSPNAGKGYFPKLTAALRARDFRTAAVECFMPEEAHISGLRPRNRANRVLYVNAALSTDPAVLFWPTDLAQQVDTDPEIPNPASAPTVYAPDFPIIHKLPGDDEPDDAA